MNARSRVDFSPPSAASLQTLEAVGVAVRLAEKTLLHTTSVQFLAGQVTAIAGPNGAGKSTLMSVLTGQRKPDQGRVDLGGKALQAFESAELARVRAFVAQETQVAFDFTVQEVVALGRYPHRRHPSAQESGIALLAMQATKVAHLAERALNTLSGGEKARVHLARALAQVWEPVALEAGNDSPVKQGRPLATRWLLLDEPTAALDLQHQHRMLQLARDWATTQGIGVVAVLHDLNLALRYSDRCVVLQQGRVVASGPTSEVLTPERIAEVWHVAACPVTVPAPARPLVSPARLQYVFEPLP